MSYTFCIPKPANGTISQLVIRTSTNPLANDTTNTTTGLAGAVSNMTGINNNTLVLKLSRKDIAAFLRGDEKTALRMGFFAKIVDRIKSIFSSGVKYQAQARRILVNETRGPDASERFNKLVRFASPEAKHRFNTDTIPASSDIKNNDRMKLFFIDGKVIPHQEVFADSESGVTAYDSIPTLDHQDDRSVKAENVMRRSASTQALCNDELEKKWMKKRDDVQNPELSGANNAESTMPDNGVTHEPVKKKSPLRKIKTVLFSDKQKKIEQRRKALENYTALVGMFTNSAGKKAE